MQYYEAYEDVLDEDYGDAYDDAFDDDYDDAYDDSYDESDDEAYDDSYDESDGEDFGEARKNRSQRRAARARRRNARNAARAKRRNPRSVRRNEGKRRPLKPRAPSKPAPAGAVKNAFDNVGQDLNKVNRDLQKEKAKQANEQINELLALFLFQPKLKPIYTGQFVDVFDKEGNELDLKGNPFTPIAAVAASGAGMTPVIVARAAKLHLESSEKLKVELINYELESNLIPLLAVKLLSNMQGVDSSKGIQRFLPLAAGFALSPSARSMFDTKPNTDKPKESGDFLKDLTDKPLLMLGLLLLVVNWGKLPKK